jgi:hypothetical protein
VTGISAKYAGIAEASYRARLPKATARGSLGSQSRRLGFAARRTGVS